MTAQPVMGLREFTKARQDSRLLLLDSRLPEEREAQPLANPFFSVAYAPRTTVVHDAIHLAMIVGDRHVVVVDIDEADAARVAQTLREAGVTARPLERGLFGWRDALVEECVERKDGVEIVTLLRVANGRRRVLRVRSPIRCAATSVERAEINRRSCYAFGVRSGRLHVRGRHSRRL